MNQSPERQERKNGASSEGRERYIVPRTDVIESKDGLVLIADLPGVDEKNVDIGIEKDNLTITARMAEIKVDGPVLRRRELAQGTFRRVFQLSEDLDTSRIEATMKHGVLRLSLPKSERSKPRKIEVKAA